MDKKNDEKERNKPTWDLINHKFSNYQTDYKEDNPTNSLNEKMFSIQSYNDVKPKFLSKKKNQKNSRKKFIKHPALGIFSRKGQSLPKYTELETQTPKARRSPPIDQTFDQCLYPSKHSSSKVDKSGRMENENFSWYQIEEEKKRKNLLKVEKEGKHKRLLSAGWKQEKNEILEKKLTPILISQSSISNDILSDFDKSIVQKSAVNHALKIKELF